MRFSVIFKFLLDVGRNLISVEFGRIFRLVELGRFLRYRVDISRSFRLVDLGGSFRF